MKAKVLAASAVLAFSAVAVSVGQGLTPAHGQSAPVQAGQTPQQSEQSRARDRSRAEDVRIGRDWKAKEGKNDRAGRAPADQEHETVGRDWRAHPAGRDQ